MTSYYDPGYLEKIAGPAVTTGEYLAKILPNFSVILIFFRISNFKKN